MFQFWYEKNIVVAVPFLVFISIFVIVIYAFYTTVFVEPAENAPFVQDIRAESAKSREKAAVDNIILMDKPHIADNEMKNWISNIVSESLFFNKQNYSENAKKIRPYFTNDGFQRFQDYLIDSGIAESIRVNDYDMSVYIEESPLYLNSSVIKGVYKWLYQMPVVISFFPTGQKNTAKQADKFINKKISLRLQITRAKIGDDPDAIQIEDWIVSGR